MKIKRGVYSSPLILNNVVEYDVWSNMRNRCNNPNHPNFNSYGGRGITICDRWNNFAYFLQDMGKRPSANLSIDRINNNKGYSLDNCRWATAKVQNNNQRTRKYHRYSFIVLNGRKALRLYEKKKHKLIYCPEDDKLFDNCAEAARFYGTSRQHVHKQVKTNRLVFGKKLVHYVDF